MIRMARIVMVGAGQAAAVAARALRRRGFDGGIEIVGAEPHRPYQRPPLSKEFLSDGDDTGLYLLNGDWCEANDVRLRLGQRAERVDASAAAVELADGTRLRADSVLIATGASPRRLAGPQGERIHYLRTLDDSRRLRAQLTGSAHVIVVGAGFLGAEVAATARGHGAAVTMIEAQDVPMRALLGQAGAACASLHRANGTELRLAAAVESIAQTPAGVLVTTREDRIEGDLAVIAIGVEPDAGVARNSGIIVGNGIVVDEYCRTSQPCVYAAGDVACHYHPLFGEHLRVEHADHASRQAAAAADNMLGRPRAYDAAYWSWSDQYGVSLQFAGHARERDQVVVRGRLADLDFCAFYLRAGRVVAAFGMDRGNEVALARELIEARRPVEAADLADEDTDLAELSGVEEYA